MKSTHRFWLALLLWLPWAVMAAPRAWLDRDSIRLGETVTLNVETDVRGGTEPDFSALDRDFRRLGTSSNTQLSFVNGRQHARTLWAVALEPLREGVIGIPAFDIGGERTEPLTLTVLPTPSGGSAAAGDDVFLEIEAEPAAPYVQQQVRYTVRLHYAVQILEGQIDEPQLQGLQARRLGNDITYTKNLAGRRYSVVERRYALTPEASGRIEIPGLLFRGRVLAGGTYGSLMSPRANVAARGNAVALDVRPRPASAATPWLPAQSLLLVDESPRMKSQLAVGEPITLTLRLRAQGLAAEQLPELELPRIEGAEIYPDQESSQTSDDGQFLHGERVRKFALVPTRPGPLRLPEVAIDWWNTDADRAERARLPAREWSVAGDATAVSATPAAGDAPLPSQAAQRGAATDAAAAWNFWPWATAAFALLWIATLLWRRRAPVTTAAASSSQAAPPPPLSWREALAQTDPAALARALVRTARAGQPACRNLADIARRLDDPAQREAIDRLDRALYRGGDSAEAVAAVRLAFRGGPRWARTGANQAAADTLPPLYPEG